MSYLRTIEISDDFFNYKNGSDIFLGGLLIKSTYSSEEHILYTPYFDYYDSIFEIQNRMGYTSRRSLANQFDYWLTRSNGYLTKEKRNLYGIPDEEIFIFRSPKEDSFQVEIDIRVIEKIINTGLPNIFRTYVWLLAQQKLSKGPFHFAKTDFTKVIGYNSEKPNSEIWKKLVQNLETLKELKIISYNTQISKSSSLQPNKKYFIINSIVKAFEN